MKVDFSCRLPVIESPTYGGLGNVYSGGFVTFPSATFALEPAGGIKESNGSLITHAKPTLSNDRSQLGGLPFYDAPQHRLVPVSSNQSTADGAFYAYSTWDGVAPSMANVHIVDVGRASENVFAVPVAENARGFTVADFDSSGIYLLANAFEQSPGGVWLLNAKTGSLRRLAQLNSVVAVRKRYAWEAIIDPRDPSPPQLRRSGTPSDTIVRVDLATGARKVWFYRPGVQVSLVGFDSKGGAVIEVADPSGASTRTETWLVDEPTAASIINAGDLHLFSPQGDGERLWFGGSTGAASTEIYLYTQAHGLQKVFTDPRPNESVAAVGFCR